VKKKKLFIYIDAAEAEQAAGSPCLLEGCSVKPGNGIHWIPANWSPAHPGSSRSEFSSRQVVQLPCVTAYHTRRVYYHWEHVKRRRIS